MRRSSLLAVALTALSLAVASCGSSDPPEGEAASSAPPPVTEPATTTSTNPPSSTAPPATTPPSLVDRPSATSVLEVDDGTFGSVAEMAAASDLVVVGEVVDLESLGRPDLAEDPNADEYLAVTITTMETLKGEPAGEIVLAWHAFQVGADGERVATLITNGVRPPDLGDRLLLFVDSVDPAFDEHVGGAPTHALVKLDGIGYLDGNRVTEAESRSSAADQLVAMSLDELRDALAG